MKATVKTLKQLQTEDLKIAPAWQLACVVNDDNLTYVVSNSDSREAVVVDPMREDSEIIAKILAQDLKGYRLIAVIDTHTHADHVSCAAELAEKFGAPLIQHHLSPSQRVHLRFSRDTQLSTGAGPLRFLLTPGHTHDSVTPIWGPFLFGGDTLMYGDTGRDDLPTGDPAAHWESLQKIKAAIDPETVMLPGHDGEGGRVSTWRHQLEINSSLKQGRADFIKDAGAYVGPSPKLLKEALFENFK